MANKINLIVAMFYVVGFGVAFLTTVLANIL